MRIFVVDDEGELVEGLGIYLRALRHDVVCATSPLEAVACLRSNGGADLVISDVGMAGMDGFHLALQVAEILGTTPPRTLLMSGNDHLERLCALPANVLIGIIRKPFRFVKLLPLLNFIERTRARCPGRVADFCAQHDAAGARRPRDPGRDEDLCATAGYSLCDGYRASCGRRVQEWVSRSRSWLDLPQGGAGAAPATPDATPRR